jgi:hypothetical protein
MVAHIWWQDRMILGCLELGHSSLGFRTWWLGAHTKGPVATWSLGHDNLGPYLGHAQGL